MSRPLTQPEALDFMSEFPEAIIKTPSPGMAMVHWSARATNVMITKDAANNPFLTDVGESFASLVPDWIYINYAAPVAALWDWVAAHGGETGQAVADAIDSIAQGTAERLGQWTAAAIRPVTDTASSLLWLALGLGVLYLVGHKRGAFPSLML